MHPADRKQCCCYGQPSMAVMVTLVTDSITYEGWNFNSGNYLFTTDTK